MTDATKKEWDSITDKDSIFIYGAAKTAISLYSFISQLGCKNIKGFLVTEKKDNPEKLFDLPVEDIHNFNNKEAHILVPHLGIYKEQISKLLDSLGYKNVYLLGQLMSKTQLEENETFRNINKKYINDQNIELKNEHVYIQKQILDILNETSPDFGGVMPYQSLELIGLEGMRPTEYRIQEYGLREVLKIENDVLDIGCNMGFFDISIANLVHSVTGIEYDLSLVKAAKLVMEYLNVSNCTFYNCDFNDWLKGKDVTYDVIFSFAIHHWLHLSSQEYVTILNKLLRRNGYICFESHIYGADDEFDECYKKFQDLGYRTICDKQINDNGLQERQYILLQKVN